MCAGYRYGSDALCHSGYQGHVNLLAATCPSHPVHAIVEFGSLVEGVDMTKKLEVSPIQLEGAAREMGELRDRVRTILSNLENSLDGLGAPWGPDGYGSSFADGNDDNGYLAARKNLTEGIGNVANTFGAYHDGQLKAAKELRRMDKTNIRG